VLLALYLVSHSKAVNEGVGFDTQVAVVIKAGAWLEPKQDVAEMEEKKKGSAKQLPRWNNYSLQRPIWE
jgi:hypothetical protein